MGLQPLGLQRHLEWPGVEMEVSSSSSASVSSGPDTCPDGVCPRSLAKESDHGEKIHQVPGAPLLRPQEAVHQGESHSGLVYPQHPYPVRQVPDAHHFANTVPSIPWGLHHLHRSYRRLLVYSDCTEVDPLPWLQTGRKGLRVQSYAIRTEHSSQDLHQIGRRDRNGTSVPGDSCGSLSGRLAGLGPKRGGLPQGGPRCSTVPSVSRILHQREEVKTGSSSILPVAGPSLGPGLSQTVSSSREEIVHRQVSPLLPPDPPGLTPVPRESFGVSAVRVGDRPDPQSPPERRQQGVASEGQSPLPGQQGEGPSDSQEEAPPVVDGQESLPLGSSPPRPL